MKGSLALLGLLIASTASAQQVSLRLGGKEVSLDAANEMRLVALAQEMFGHCGPNSLQHAGNFGPAALTTDKRLQSVAQGSRLQVRFTEPFVTTSHLGGTLGVSEAVIGLGEHGYFVGPSFTRHGGAWVEHLQCEYLPALELACSTELAAHLPASHRETCAKLERDSRGRIVMPPPDIAPSCS
ncbi:MAG: hypothetical protein ABR570_10375 [Burkholderiales bacterium]